MNQEIFSPDDLDQFQFSPSDKRTSTQPITAYASSHWRSYSSAKPFFDALEKCKMCDDALEF
jgi:hypothetical protein